VGEGFVKQGDESFTFISDRDLGGGGVKNKGWLPSSRSCTIGRTVSGMVKLDVKRRAFGELRARLARAPGERDIVLAGPFADARVLQKEFAKLERQIFEAKVTALERVHGDEVEGLPEAALSQ